MGAIIYKAFKGSQWKALTLLTAFLYPGITFGIFFTLNFFIWGQASSGAVPFGTMFALLCIWFLISFPLVWVGVWLGYRRSLTDPPVKTNMVPRVIPSQAWYLHLLFTMVIGGILPFGAVFIELYFIMSSVWLQRFYYVFGFLALVRSVAPLRLPTTDCAPRTAHCVLLTHYLTYCVLLTYYLPLYWSPGSWSVCDRLSLSSSSHAARWPSSSATSSCAMRTTCGSGARF